MAVGVIVEQPSVVALLNDDSNGGVENCVGNLAGRAVAHWRMLPALAFLIVSIIGIVAAVINQQYFICACFASGAAVSIFFTIFAYHYKHLQSLGASSQSIATSSGRLGVNVEEMERENIALKEANERLKGNIGNLEDQIRDLNSANATHASNLETSIATATRFEKLYTEAQRETETHKAQLQDVRLALSEVEKSAREDQATFAANLAIFVEKLQKLDTTSSGFNTFLGSMQDTLGKSNAAFQQQLDRFTSLGKEAQKIAAEVGELKGQSQQLGQHVADLSKQKEGLATVLKEFEELLPRYQQALLDNEQRDKAAAEVLAAFQKFFGTMYPQNRLPVGSQSQIAVAPVINTGTSVDLIT